jgi:8-oxo-dGTP pyrophosphatase MutT (NUDIX family)
MNEKICDNKSVGIVIRNTDGAFALLKRARFPFGFAPVAGHIDQHGSVEQAAVEETIEELGLTITVADLKKTDIFGARFNNHCRRKGGTHHDWWIFEVNNFSGELQPSPDETQGAAWYPLSDLQLLADRTRQYQAQMIGQQDWENSPGLEEIWITFMEQLGYIH